MKNQKQIVLFLKKNTHFNQTRLAAKLNEKFIQLGNPLILPPNEKDLNQPLIIFNQGMITLTINYNEISFIFSEERKQEENQLLVEIIELFENLDLDFIRMGYISTYINGKKEKERFKEKIFKEEKLINDDFQLAWYTKELIDSVSVNVWERYFTDFHNNLELVSIFDINTPVEEEYNISSEFIETFLKKCDKFIEEKLKDRL